MTERKMGFTLLEAVIALGLFTIASLSSTHTLINSQRHYRDSQEIQRADEIAKTYMELIRNVGYHVLYTTENDILIQLPNGEWIEPGVEQAVPVDIYGDDIPAQLRILVDITAFDSPIDGTGVNDWDTDTQDYKLIRMTVSFENLRGLTITMDYSTYAVYT